MMYQRNLSTWRLSVLEKRRKKDEENEEKSRKTRKLKKKGRSSRKKNEEKLFSRFRTSGTSVVAPQWIRICDRSAGAASHRKSVFIDRHKK